MIDLNALQAARRIIDRNQQAPATVLSNVVVTAKTMADALEVSQALLVIQNNLEQKFKSTETGEVALDELSNWLKTAYGARIGICGWGLPAIPDHNKLKKWHDSLAALFRLMLSQHKEK